MPTYSPVCFLDRVDNLSLVERNGVIRSLTRKATVLFNTQPPPNRPTDFTVLSEALNASDMPLPYSTLADQGYDNLVLVERAPSVANNEPCQVDVILKYEHILEGPNQKIVNPQSGFLFGKGRCSISEKTSNFYYPFGDPTKPKTLILVAHTFNPNETGLSGQFVWKPQLPYTIIQGGEISIPFPQANYKMVGYLTTQTPWITANRFIAAVNSKPWLGYPELTWLCSEVDFEVMDTVANNDFQGLRYKFGFEFQYNVDTWYPTVAFQDQRTGRPPAKLYKADRLDPDLQTTGVFVRSYTTNPKTSNLQPGGYWNVPCLRQLDFATEFAATFEQ